MKSIILVQPSLCGKGFDISIYNKEDEALIADDWSQSFDIELLEKKYNASVTVVKGY